MTASPPRHPKPVEPRWPAPEAGVRGRIPSAPASDAGSRRPGAPPPCRTRSCTPGTSCRVGSVTSLTSGRTLVPKSAPASGPPSSPGRLRSRARRPRGSPTGPGPPRGPARRTVGRTASGWPDPCGRQTPGVRDSNGRRRGNRGSGARPPQGGGVFSGRAAAAGPSLEGGGTPVHVRGRDRRAAGCPYGGHVPAGHSNPLPTARMSLHATHSPQRVT